jgi:hypothetical protein
MSPVITLTHHEHGAMRVRISEDATWWERKRIWTDTDSDGRLYEDSDFAESDADINLKLLAARASQIAAEPPRSGILMALHDGERAP